MDLKIYVSQTTQLNAQSQQIHYAGGNPYALSVQVGPLPSQRQWQNYGSYIDVTDYVSDLFKLKLTWTTERDDNGAVTPGATQSKKSASGTLSFEGLAYTLIRNWLIEDVSAHLNSVSVKIEHVGCGTYENYRIRSQDITWCESSPNNSCQFDLILTQKDEALTCIHNTVITARDGDRDWFPDKSQIPSGNKKHPRFSYCNEIRPNGQLVMLWFIAGINAAIMISFIVPIIVLVINPIIALLHVIKAALNAIGIGNGWKIPGYFNPKDVFDSYAAQFVESAGCGREHPAPLIRDYVYNVCKICGLDADLNSLAVTAPLLFAQNLSVETSSRGVINVKNEYYMLSLFHAQIKRGIRRFESLNIFTGPNPNGTDFWIPENAPIWTLTDLLNYLKPVFNAEWRVVNNKLYFQRKDYYVNGKSVIDVSEHGQHAHLLLEGVCFDWNEVKQPATGKGMYVQDNIDTCGNEAMQPMNGPALFFGDHLKNPTYYGILDKTVQFGATKFRLDGASTDYIYDAMQVVINGSVFTPFLMGLMRDFVAPKIAKYADFALLLKDETATLPKLLIWDGESYENARAVRLKCPAPNMPLPQPDINTPYNNYPSPTPWDKRHELSKHTFVIGSALTLGNSPYGYYKVQDFFGIQITKQPAILVNYPMYYEPGYRDTLWDYFHWIDDPNRKPFGYKNASMKLELCCDTLNALGVFKDASNIKLGYKVRVNGKYLNEVVIKEITVSYDPSEQLGQYIEIRGEA